MTLFGRVPKVLATSATLVVMNRLGTIAAMGLVATSLMAQSDGSINPSDSTAGPTPMRSWRDDDQYGELRRAMVDLRVAAAGVTDARVLAAVAATPRHRFVPASQRPRAYFDMALPIGGAQTISSPFIVAAMTEALQPRETDRVLEIGTGSGYQAAVLSPLVSEVYTIEIVSPLGRAAQRTLSSLGYDNVRVRIGDGFAGWPEAAPFDKMIVTCSPESVPDPLVNQLAEGGSIIIPIGQRYQQTLCRLTKTDGVLVREDLRPTLFVPMTGSAEDARAVQPDPANPRLVNADFEESVDQAVTDDPAVEKPEPVIPGWYYGRQVGLVPNGSGGHAVRFDNQTPGLASHLMQGLAVDGRIVPRMRLETSVKTENVAVGPGADQWPMATVTFYDELRREVGYAALGPYRGTRDWRTESRLVRVPPTAREAIVRLGMFGATGSASFDYVRLEPR